MSDKWYAIDYSGWIKINFKTMQLKFDDGINNVNINSIKRVDSNQWEFETDNGGWDSIDIDCGDNVVSQEIESHYKKYVDEVFHSKVIDEEK
ncbi:MAG: hypothetical protein HWN81_00475 [Candidatus Lokiarchaeota archaeon]|nr:hypothetical protein [Candidatus Lokiarchaeota archaeon]